MLNFTAIIDSREQKPLPLKFGESEIKTEVGTLYTGDYSIKGLERHVAIERKSLDDLMGCIGKHRERFDKEIQRMLGYPVRALVVESTWREIESGLYRSKIHPNAAMGSLLGWVALGIPVLMSGNHVGAAAMVSRLLYVTARRRHAELKSLVG
jgi:ERCC4-type nuclease